MHAVQAKSALLCLCVLSCLGACADDLPQATEIVDMRVLGARTEVVGDEARANPEPGEDVNMHWAVVHPDPAYDRSQLASMFITCTYPEQFAGVPLCQEFIDLAREGGGGDEAPTLDTFACEQDVDLALGPLTFTCISGEPIVKVPVATDFEGPRKLVVGVICESGRPAFDPSDPQLFSCEGAKEGSQNVPVYGSVRIQSDTDTPNLNPSASDVTVLINGEIWEPVPDADLPPADDCLESGLPVIDTYKHTIGLRMAADSRELADGEPESAEFSLYTTEGELDERFIVFEGEDEGEDGLLEDDIEWTAPSRDDANPNGTLARVFVSMLDRRGGFDLVTRAACVHACAAPDGMTVVSCDF